MHIWKGYVYIFSTDPLLYIYICEKISFFGDDVEYV